MIEAFKLLRKNIGEQQSNLRELRNEMLRIQTPTLDAQISSLSVLASVMDKTIKELEARESSIKPEPVQEL